METWYIINSMLKHQDMLRAEASKKKHLRYRYPYSEMLNKEDGDDVDMMKSVDPAAVEYSTDGDGDELGLLIRTFLIRNSLMEKVTDRDSNVNKSELSDRDSNVNKRDLLNAENGDADVSESEYSDGDIHAKIPKTEDRDADVEI